MNVWIHVRHKVSHPLRREDGSAMVEFAIVLPILLLLFAGTAELGRLFYTYTTLAKATKVGARYLSNSKDATSSDPTAQGNAIARAKSLVVCGLPVLDCTGATPVVNGLTSANVAVTLSDRIEGTVTVKYVKVEITGYSYQKGVFNLAGMTGQPNATFYFALKPGTEMRYML
jgi:Flp pilus assembly protein TadG